MLSMTACHLRRESVVQQRYHNNRKGDFTLVNLSTALSAMLAIYRAMEVPAWHLTHWAVPGY